MKKVDFFIVGNSKSGTTAIYKFLKQHDDICMSNPKEPNFFATDFLHEVDTGAFTRKTLTEYHQMFDNPEEDKLWGEASACYLYSKEAAQNIKSYNPRGKIIAIFREPVDFLHSYHLQMIKNPVSEGETIKNFEEALAKERDRKRGREIPDGCLIPELLYYSDRILYSDQIQRFYNQFDESSIKVIIYDDFKSDNKSIMESIFDFLGVDSNLPEEFDKYNKSQKLRSKKAQNILYDLSHGNGKMKGVSKFIKYILPQPIRKRATDLLYHNFVFKSAPDVDPTLETALKARFKPEVVKLGSLVGRDLVDQWGYHDV